MATYEGHPESKERCAYSPRTCFVAADHWFLVFSVMLKSFLMQLYVGSCHVVSAEIAVVMAVPIENPADCELRGVIRFLQTDEIIRLSCRRGKLSRGSRHKSCCVSSSTGTSSSILRTVRT